MKGVNLMKAGMVMWGDGFGRKFRWSEPDESRHGNDFGEREYTLDEPDESRHGDDCYQERV